MGCNFRDDNLRRSAVDSLDSKNSIDFHIAVPSVDIFVRFSDTYFLHMKKMMLSYRYV